MFAIVKNDEIVKLIQPHQEFTLDGKTYSAQWTVRMSAQDKAKMGITPVYTQPRPDERFYWVTANAPKLVNGVPTINHTCVEKNPADLRAQFIAQAKDTANKELATTDWMVIRKAERNIDLPEEVQAQRAAIIQTCTDLEAAVSATETLDELIDVVAPGATKAEDVIAYAEPPEQPEPIQAEPEVIQEPEGNAEEVVVEEIVIAGNVDGNIEGNSDV